MNTPDPLFLIRSHCLRTLEATQEALKGMLVTGDNYFDDPEARAHLSKVMNTTKALLSHLEFRYEFGNSLAVLKENR